jgi:hypothetical protein
MVLKQKNYNLETINDFWSVLKMSIEYIYNKYILGTKPKNGFLVNHNYYYVIITL